MVGTTLKECGENLPCGYYSKAGIITMKCGTGLQPSLDKVKCHSEQSDDYKTNWKCYCITEGCNHKCEYKKEPCADEPVDGETHKVCDGTCMAKNTGVKNTTNTMKTMKTEKTMGPTKVTTIAPKQPTIKTMVSGPNEMGTTSKSSNTNAAAFHVLVGMVILTTKQFL